MADTIDGTNFREFAQKALASYASKGMLADHLVWGRIVGEYEEQRASLLEAAEMALAQLRVYRAAAVRPRGAPRPTDEDCDACRALIAAIAKATG